MKKQYGSRYGRSLDNMGASARVKSGTSYIDHAKAEDDRVRGMLNTLQPGSWAYYERLGYVMLTRVTESRLFARLETGVNVVFTGVSQSTPGLLEYESIRYPHRLIPIKTPTDEQREQTEAFLRAQKPSVEEPDVDELPLQPGCR